MHFYFQWVGWDSQICQKLSVLVMSTDRDLGDGQSVFLACSFPVQAFSLSFEFEGDIIPVRTLLEQFFFGCMLHYGIQELHVPSFPWYYLPSVSVADLGIC